MKIVVAYKWAPNPHDASVSASGVVDWSRAKASVSEYDPVAIELARALADAHGAELIGVSVGSPAIGTPAAKKAALSRGLDRLVLASDAALADAGPTTLGLAIADLIRGIGGVGVVLTGESSIDVGSQTVPAIVAGALGWPLASGVTRVTGTAGDLTIERTFSGGVQVLRATGPVVLAASGDAVTPRVPGMKDILAAGKKPSQLVDAVAPALASDVEMVSTAKPQLPARQGTMLDTTDPFAAASELVRALRDAGTIKANHR